MRLPIPPRLPVPPIDDAIRSRILRVLLALSCSVLTACGDDSVSLEWPEEEVRPRIWFHTTNPVVVVGDSVGVEVRAGQMNPPVVISVAARDTTVARVSENFFVIGVRPGTTVLVATAGQAELRDSTTVRVVAP